MARETQTIAQRLKLLENNSQTLPAPIPPAHQVDRNTFPPHLYNALPIPGRTAVTSHQQQGAADPLTPAIGLAEPINLAHVTTDPAKTAPHCGLPQPGEASQE